MSFLTKKKNRIQSCSLKDAAFCPAGNNRSFTLLELIVVVIIMGVISGFALASYLSIVENSKEREAAVYLKSIYVAYEMFRADTGEYPSGAGSTLTGAAEINAEFGNRINLPTADIGLQFECSTIDAETFLCNAYRPTIAQSNWNLEMKNSFCFGKAYCGSSSCPSLEDDSTQGCPEDPDNP